MESVDKYLGRVRGLLAKAESTEFGPERDALLAKADELMVKYQIDEEAARAAAPSKSAFAPPVVKRFTVCDRADKFSHELIVFAMVAFQHAGCKMVNLPSPFDDRARVAVVGYEADIATGEALWASLSLQMNGDREPKPNPTESYDANVLRLHDSGVKWERIKDLMNAAVGTAHWAETPWPDGKRLLSAYRRECKRLGVQPKVVSSPLNYQRSFIAAYTSRLEARLKLLRNARPASTEVALYDRASRVNDALNEAFPDLRRGKGRQAKVNADAYTRGVEAANRANLGGKAATHREAGALR